MTPEWFSHLQDSNTKTVFPSWNPDKYTPAPAQTDPDSVNIPKSFPEFFAIPAGNPVAEYVSFSDAHIRDSYSVYQ